ncbi:hypothetical protein N7481_004956 [Penicillium waksmanii]|uniref:uncharacterized protein n=1 Tax=Penicillium waksmanii TaxID=69791 RepID=UPI00254693C9|nr:uncharacterized protein N7481_004956 [Penicillium waksmanii]KAJ5982857.1 hypothetical protein N7481_004956 [Penicillium waksmanii]
MGQWKRWIGKLQAPTDPGLSTAQLMLTNDYLKPASDLYSARKDSLYYGFYGISWHVYAAYFCGILINIVGFAGAVRVDVPVGALYIYNVNYFSGFIVSGAVYWLLAWLVPIPGTSVTRNEIPYEISSVPDLDEKKVEEA